MEARIPGHPEETSNQLSTAADQVPVEDLALADSHLAAIVRSMKAVDGRIGNLVHRAAVLQAEAHHLTTALANLRDSLRRAATRVRTEHLSRYERLWTPGSFVTPRWLAQVARKIDPKTTRVTTGLIFDSAGRHVKTVESGRDDLSRSAQAALSSSRQFPKPPGWRPGDEFAAADHVETKVAIWLTNLIVSRGEQHLVVVINKNKPGGRPYGCQVAVRTILPAGTALTVVSSITGLRRTLKGVAPS